MYAFGSLYSLCQAKWLKRVNAPKLKATSAAPNASSYVLRICHKMEMRSIKIDWDLQQMYNQPTLLTSLQLKAISFLSAGCMRTHRLL